MCGHILFQSLLIVPSPLSLRFVKGPVYCSQICSSRSCLTFDGPRLYTTFILALMSDGSDSPSSLDSLPRARTRGSQPRRSHKSTKAHDHAHLGGSSKELLRLLIYEEREAHDLRALLQDMTSRYKDEVQRAELAESRAKEVILRFKEANDARLAAQQESMRMREELALYKLQLENAQQEIMKGQQMLDAVEAQRHEAEEAAARARTTARRFKEERLMQQAKEEGRMEGVKEGFARGRVLGYEEARATGFTRFIPTDIEDFKQSAVVSPEAQPVVSSGPETSKSSPPNAPSLPLEPDPNIRIYSPAGTQTLPTVVATPARSFRNPASPLIPVHNVSGSPQHMLANYLPEGWIPTIDGDRIRLPPPHELSPAPPTPSTTPKLSPRSHPRVTVEDVPEEPILMIPPPFISERNTADSDSDTVSVRSTAKRPRNRRRKSIDSQSTTVSQFDILGPPIASSARGNAAARSNVLSAIVEDSERERSPSMSSMMYAPMMTPNAVSPMVMPTLRAPVASVPGPDLSQLGQQEQYKRSESRASALRDGPSRNESRQSTGRRASDASSMLYTITVEPPSRPESGRSAISAGGQYGGLLTPSDANRPLPTVSEVKAPVPDVQKPMVINQLPPGFIPSGPPLQSAPAHNNITAVGVPLPPSVAPSMSRLYAPSPSGTTPAGPSGQTTEPTPVIPLPPPSTGGMPSGRYSRSALQKDSSSEDEPDSSGVSDSSMDSLTTPPARRIPMVGQFYEVAPTPPNVVYPLPTSTSSGPGTSQAARVPLPPSSAGSPRTSAAARVPLPVSSAGTGSPRSVYTRMSRPGRTGSAAGSAVGRWS